MIQIFSEYHNQAEPTQRHLIAIIKEAFEICFYKEFEIMTENAALKRYPLESETARFIKHSGSFIEIIKKIYEAEERKEHIEELDKLFTDLEKSRDQYDNKITEICTKIMEGALSDKKLNDLRGLSYRNFFDRLKRHTERQFSFLD